MPWSHEAALLVSFIVNSQVLLGEDPSRLKGDLTQQSESLDSTGKWVCNVKIDSEGGGQLNLKL